MNVEMKPILFVVVLVVCGIMGYSVISGQPTPIPSQVNSVFGLTMDRFDYLISDPASNGFQTTAPLRGSVIIVVRNGLIQTAGVDYSNSSAISGRTKVVFNTGVLQAGDRVSILYWR